jgi:hypothetical protein
MNASDPNFFLLLLFGAIIAGGVLPASAPALVMLCFLRLLGSYPLIAILLAAAWLLRKLVWDFLVALVLGFGAGLGARMSGVFRRGGRFRD